MLAGHEPAATHATTPFMLVALPDTQFYSKNAQAMFSAQTQWIVDQKAAQNIVFATHLGDITDDGSSSTQWSNADAAIDILDGKIPYSMSFGNHDLHWDYLSGDGWNNCKTYFGPSRYGSYAWFGGASTSGLDTFQMFSAGDYNFLHINLRYHPDSSDMAWAQGILTSHASLPTIISTHTYLNINGTRDTIGTSIWNTLVKSNSQVFMVLNGHYSGENQLISTNDFGGKVIQMVSDYQSYPNNGNGFLRELIFDPDASLIRVKTYSPTLGAFESDADSQFAYSVSFAAKITVNGLTSYPICTRDWRAVTGSWNSTSNWLQGSMPENGGTTVLNFGGTGSYTSTNNLAGVFTVNKMSFANSGNILLNQSGAATGLMLDGSGSTIVVSGSGAVNITTPIAFASDATITVSPSAGQLSLQAADTITGSGSLTIANSSTKAVLLGNAGGFMGNILVKYGTLKLSNTGGDALGNSTILTINPGATFDFNGNGENLGGLEGGGTVVADGISLVFFAAGDRTFSGVISGASGKVTQSGSGSLVLSGSNSYTGATTVANGEILAGANDVLADQSALVVNGGAFNLNGYHDTVASLSGSGGSITLGRGTLTIGFANSSTTAAAVISGSGSLVKIGTGTQTLTGANTYAGGTTINRGVLVAVSSSALGSGDVTLNGGTLRYLGPTAGWNRAIAINGSGTLDVAASETTLTQAGPLTGNGSLVKQGKGTLVLSGNNHFLGSTYVAAGTLVLTCSTALPDGSALVVGAGASLLFDPELSAAAGAEPQGSVVSIPEPGTGVLLIAGLGLLVLYHRFRPSATRQDSGRCLGREGPRLSHAIRPIRDKRLNFSGR